MVFDFKTAFAQKIQTRVQSAEICGMVAQDGTVYPLGSDTKVLSTIFELFTRPLMIEIANENGLILVEPSAQNHYPDFTLYHPNNPGEKIAIDVKTTYITRPHERFGFTLGGYTSFIRPGNERKNIVFPFTDYCEHIVIGYVYERAAAKQAAVHATYTINQLNAVPMAYHSTRLFVQDKWKIASASAGSGNTTNIGSIYGTLEDFAAGCGPFENEAEFLDYWRNYGTTAATRTNYSNLAQYRLWRSTTAPTPLGWMSGI